MKTLRIILLLFIVSCCFSCMEIDYNETENKYWLENDTNDTIHVEFTLYPRYYFADDGSTKRRIAPHDTGLLGLAMGGSEAFPPSKLFQRIMFLSPAKDTLYIMENIDDSEWAYSDTILSIEHGLGYYDWTYTFSK